MSKLKPYNKYQPVEYDYVSEIPEGWQLLPNIAIFQERIERGFIDEELLSVTIGKGVIRQKDVSIKKDSSNEDKSKYKLIKIGDIAYNKMRMWQGSLGYSKYRGISSPAYVILNPKMEINAKFFHYMFRTGFYTNYSKRFSYGIVDDQLSLRYVDFKRMYSIFPPLETQNKIVTYLDKKTKKLNEFIKKKERLIELLEERKKRSISIKLSTKKDTNYKDSGVDWIGLIPKDWNVVNLKYLVKEKLKYGANEEAKDSNVNDPRYIRITDFGFDGKLRKDTYRSLPPNKAKGFFLEGGDLLFARSGATVGKTFQFKDYDGDACFAGYLIKAVPNEKLILSDFLYLYTQSLFFEDWKNQIFNKATIENIGADKYSVLKVIVPKIADQLRIIEEARIESIEFDRVIDKANSEIKKAKEYQESLITQMVTGQLKVPIKAKEKVNH